MRKPVLFAGIAVLLVGIVLAVVASYASASAATQVVNCTFTLPGQFFSPECMNAMNAVFMWGIVSTVGWILLLVGIVLAIVGAVIEPPSPPMPYAPAYPAYAYQPAPPPAPPQTQAPPPRGPGNP